MDSGVFSFDFLHQIIGQQSTMANFLNFAREIVLRMKQMKKTQILVLLAKSNGGEFFIILINDVILYDR